MSWIICYVPLNLGNNCNDENGAGQYLSSVKCARVWRILFAAKIASASYKFWKGNSEMHHLWKKSQGITRHRKAFPANKGVCDTLPCLHSFPNLSLVLMVTSETIVSNCCEGCFLTLGVVAFLITLGVKQLLACFAAPESKPVKGTAALETRAPALIVQLHRACCVHKIPS